MKNLVMSAAVLGAAVLATACTTEGTVTTSWNLQNWDDTGKTAVAATCPQGGDTAIVYALPSGVTDTSLADKDIFNCAAGGGTTAGHVAGAYTVWVDITSHDGATLYARSNSQQASVTNGTNTPLNPFTFQVNRGYVSAAWTLKGASGAPLDCTSAGAAGVEFHDMVGSNLPISDQFKCTDGQGTTYPLPIADYQLGIAAIDNTKPTPKQLGPDTIAGPAAVQYGNQLVSKGSFVLSIDGL